VSSKIQITVPQACHENWQEMKPVEKGDFCNTCQKTVFDFSTASDSEIIKALKNNDVTCGRFTVNQLNRDLIEPNYKSNFWSIIIGSALTFLGIQNSTAQEKPATIQMQPNKLVEENFDEKPLIKSNPSKRVTGIVKDAYGPLPSATILVKGTTNGVTTNFDGEFSIEVNEGDVLIVSFVGMKDYELIVNEENKYNITLFINENPDEAQILISGNFCKKRNFIGRQILNIRNWFR
jgi:hypothetical protein